MKKLNIIKILQDLYPPYFRQENRMQFMFLKNSSINSLLEKFYRDFEKQKDESELSNQVLSFNQFLNNKMNNYYSTLPLNEWSGITYNHYGGCSIFDTGATYFSMSGNTGQAKVRLSTQHNLAGEKFVLKCFVQTFSEGAITPMTCFTGWVGYGQKSDFLGLQNGWNEVPMELLYDVDAGDELGLVFMTSYYSDFYCKISEISLCRAVSQPITTVSNGVDNTRMYFSTKDFKLKNPLVEVQYTNASGVTNYILQTKSTNNMAVSTITGSNSTLLTVAGEVTSGTGYQRFTIKDADFSTDNDFQITMNIIHKYGLGECYAVIKNAAGDEVSERHPITGYYDEEVYNFDVSFSGSTDQPDLFIYGVGACSWSLKLACNHIQSYTSNIYTEGNGFTVLISSVDYSSEANTYLLKQIRSKKPAGKQVKIKWF